MQGHVDHATDPPPVDFMHCEDCNTRVSQQSPLVDVDVAETNEGHSGLLDVVVLLHPLPAREGRVDPTQGMSSGHAVVVATWRRARGVAIGMSIDPYDAQVLVGGLHSSHGGRADAVIASQSEDEVSFAGLVSHSFVQHSVGVADFLTIADLRHRADSGEGRRGTIHIQVTNIFYRPPKLPGHGFEPTLPNVVRAFFDSELVLPCSEGGADHRNSLLLLKRILGTFRIVGVLEGPLGVLL
mmetsp:Transcript_81346/g.170073  ORF Transcript_81346/g.170073 Transcript_81346/m.170073 type:complete len:240 (-) Transcript_81346:233-952(-)